MCDHKLSSEQQQGHVGALAAFPTRSSTMSPGPSAGNEHQYTLVSTK